MIRRFVLWGLLGVFLIGVIGCTTMTADEKSWVADKANRSQAYVDLMKTGQTTPDQDKSWIDSQNASWQLWADKISHGLAAPALLAPKEQSMLDSLPAERSADLPGWLARETLLEKGYPRTLS